MLSCKNATALMEKKTVVQLQYREKLQLQLHVKLCRACSTYQKQSSFLDKALESEISLSPMKGNFPELHISPEIKKGILEKMKEN